MRYKIIGNNLPAVICYLNFDEAMVSENGSMGWMSPNMTAETISGGGEKKMFGRVLAGESVFLNRYSAKAGEGMIAFASSFPGTIKVLNISQSRPVIVQKSAFLAAESTVEVSMCFQKKLDKGMPGSEGLVMQRLLGHGLAFIEIDGFAVEYDLEPGQEMIVDLGHLAVMADTCTMEVIMRQGVKDLRFGGEGIFNTVVRGPGKIILQTMPLNKVAQGYCSQ